MLRMRTMEQDVEHSKPVPPVGRPFEPGQSGNPGGRPKRKPITEMLTAELETLAARSSQTKGQKIVARLVAIALQGKRSDSVAALRLILAYTEGLPVQPIDLDVSRAAARIAAAIGADPEFLIRRAEQLAAENAGHDATIR